MTGIVNKVGDELDLMMVRPRKGKKPIARTTEGVICLIDKNEDDRGFYAYDSVWRCKVVDVKQNCIVIKPIRLLATEERKCNITDDSRKKNRGIIGFIRDLLR